ncbi:MAG: SGNH/GDSL hydrolase family protein [Planctomycetota bacterium]|nr:SGNH/GDSL hydrolase family protein [Planctomycetota bacterium]MDA1212018.1 SGNH/GDSL hydrolase family protein [Planctomycetota bacterium]
MSSSAESINDPTQSVLRAARIRRWRVLLLIIGCIFGVLSAEVLLRLLGVSYPLPYQPDDDCGTVLAPDFAGWFTQEGRAYVTTNSYGLRDREYSIPKPPETFRIAVLGDSYAEAMQVDASETFWSVMERKLTENPHFKGQTVEVINFGVSGYGTAQELQMLRSRVWQFEPDLVLLAFVTGNDIRNNSQVLEPDNNRPFFMLDNGDLKLDSSFLQHPDQIKARRTTTRLKVKAINASRVLQLINHWKNHREVPEVNGADHPFAEVGIDVGCYLPPTDPDWTQAWSMTEHLLEAIHAEVDAHDAAFCVVTLSNGVQVHPDPQVRDHFKTQFEIADLLFPDHRIRDFCKRIGIHVLNLAEPMQKLAEKQHRYWHGFENTRMGTGHWNTDGHRQAGELMAEYLVRDVLNQVRVRFR